jgi:hypothetical protein
MWPEQPKQNEEHAVDDSLEVARQRHARVLHGRNGEPSEQAEKEEDQPKPQ